LREEFVRHLRLRALHTPSPHGLVTLNRASWARDHAAYLPVIILTADHDRAARKAALELELDDYLIKPLDRDLVRLRARNILQTRHLFKEVTRATGAYPKVHR